MAKSPWFQLYVKDFLADANQASMTATQAGIYIRLMCIEWNEGGKGIPDDKNQCARLSQTTPMTMLRSWTVIRRCFRPHPTNKDRLIHPRLEKERRKQALFSDRTRKGWETRTKTPDSTNLTQGDLSCKTLAKRLQNACRTDAENSPQNHSGLEKEKKKNQEKEKEILELKALSSDLVFDQQANHKEQASTTAEEAAAAKTPSADLTILGVPTRYAKRPVYQSLRFAIFEWQVDELQRMLGPHADAFDLHQWFDTLTERTASRGLVIGKSHFWEWLQAETLREAKRRGLPMLEIPTEPVLTKRTQAMLDTLKRLRES